MARIRSAGVGRTREVFYFIVYWFAAYRWKPTWRRRESDYWFALLTLVLGAIAVLITAYGALKPTPSLADVRFDTGVIEGSKNGGPKSFATPKVNEVLHLRLELTPEHQDLGRVAISIAPPASVKLSADCHYEVVGSKRRQRCLAVSGEGRIDVERLAAGETLKVTAKVKVVRPIDDRESIVIQMSSADTANPRHKQIDLYSPDEGRDSTKHQYRSG